MDVTKKSVTFRKRGGSGVTVLGNQNGTPITNGLSTDGMYEAGSGYLRTLRDTQWYTRPLHLGHKSPSSSDIPHAPPSSLATDETSPSIGWLDEELENNRCDRKLITTPRTELDMESLAKDYFPVTLSAGFNNLYPYNPDRPDCNDPSVSPPMDLHAPNETPWKIPITAGNSKREGKTTQGSGHSSGSSRSRGRKSRPDSGQSSSSSASRGSMDRMFLMTTEAPLIAGCPTLLLSSPYTSELARLRVDRLRIEEEHLLQVKRQEELERIRGPQPKWYELKTRRFHYEAHKNNDLLDNKPNWQAMMDYRNELERASKNFHNTYTSAATSS